MGRDPVWFWCCVVVIVGSATAAIWLTHLAHQGAL